MKKKEKFVIYRVIKNGRNVDALIDVNVSEEQILRKKISEVLNLVKTIYGDLTGLTLSQFKAICDRPEFEKILKSDAFDFNLNCDDQDELQVRLFIVAEEFEKFGIIV